MEYYEELLQTPSILSRVIAETPPAMAASGRAVFCGCGTSFYLGAQAAHVCAHYGVNAAAVDAVDLIDARFEPRPGDVFAFISRSGNSMETLLALDAVRAAGARSFYIGCSGESKLSALCDGSAVIEYAAETNILESYSFYAQLVLACMCAGVPAGGELPKAVERGLALSARAYREYVRGRGISRSISLSAPYYRPLMRELMLKDGEITQLPAEAWGTLEFRHGPRSWADESTLIHLTAGLRTQAWDRKVADELLSYGCPVLYYGSGCPDGAYSAGLPPEKYSLEDVLYNCAFHTGIACLIGRSLGTRPEALRNVIYNVGVL